MCNVKRARFSHHRLFSVFVGPEENDFRWSDGMADLWIEVLNALLENDGSIILNTGIPDRTHFAERIALYFEGVMPVVTDPTLYHSFLIPNSIKHISARSMTWISWRSACFLDFMTWKLVYILNVWARRTQCQQLHWLFSPVCCRSLPSSSLGDKGARRRHHSLVTLVLVPKLPRLIAYYDGAVPGHTITRPSESLPDGGHIWRKTWSSVVEMKERKHILAT